MSMHLSTKIARSIAGVLLATTAACSSSAAKSGDTTASTTGPTATTVADTNASTDSTTAATDADDAGLGTGVIAGKPFTSTAQFVQIDLLSNVWRLHIVEGEHTCADDVDGVEPAVGVDFIQPTEVPPALPASGTFSGGIGATFIADDPTVGFGPLTTTAGVTLTIDHVDDEVGQHWTGHLTVESFDQDGLTYAFDGPIDAEVCPPAEP